MFCPYCGVPVADDARFCSTCGKALAAPAQPEVVAPVVVAEPEVVAPVVVAEPEVAPVEPVVVAEPEVAPVEPVVVAEPEVAPVEPVVVAEPEVVPVEPVYVPLAAAAAPVAPVATVEEAPAPAPVEEAPAVPATKPVTVAGWMARDLIAYIPLVGPLVYLVMLFIWAFNKKREASFRNWAKSRLVWIVVAAGIVLLVCLAMLLLGFTAADLVNEFVYY